MTAVKNEKNRSKYKSRLQKTYKKDFFKGIIQNIDKSFNNEQITNTILEKKYTKQDFRNLEYNTSREFYDNNFIFPVANNNYNPNEESINLIEEIKM